MRPVLKGRALTEWQTVREHELAIHGVLALAEEKAWEAIGFIGDEERYNGVMGVDAPVAKASPLSVIARKGQSTYLVDVGDGQGRILDLKSRLFYEPRPLTELRRSELWEPFETVVELPEGVQVPVAKHSPHHTGTDQSVHAGGGGVSGKDRAIAGFLEVMPGVVRDAPMTDRVGNQMKVGDVVEHAHGLRGEVWAALTSESMGMSLVLIGHPWNKADGTPYTSVEASSRLRVLERPDPTDDYRRIMTNPEYEAEVRRLLLDDGGLASESAEALGMDRDDYVRAVSAQVAHTVANSEPWVRVNEEDVEAILREGMRTAHAGVEGSRASAPEGTVDIRGREAWERQGFGYPEMADPAKRPVYGYLSDEPDGFISAYGGGLGGVPLAVPEGQLSYYGRVGLRLKDTVRDRTTFSVGDSYANQGAVAPQPLARPSFLAVSRGVFDPRATTIRESPHGYWEVQVHGGVDISDIAEAVFPAEPSPTVQGLLAERGIPWRTAPRTFDEQGFLVLAKSKQAVPLLVKHSPHHTGTDQSVHAGGGGGGRVPIDPTDDNIDFSGVPSAGSEDPERVAARAKWDEPPWDGDFEQRGRALLESAEDPERPWGPDGPRWVAGDLEPTVQRQTVGAIDWLLERYDVPKLAAVGDGPTLTRQDLIDAGRPDLADSFAAKEWSSPGLQAAAWVFRDPDAIRIGINPKMSANEHGRFAIISNFTQAAPWLPDSNLQTFHVIHEFGHALHMSSYLGPHDREGQVPVWADTSPLAMGLRGDLTGQLGFDPTTRDSWNRAEDFEQQLAATSGTYSLKNEWEFLATAYTDYVLKGPKAHPVNRIVGERLDAEYRK